MSSRHRTFDQLAIPTWRRREKSPGLRYQTRAIKDRKAEARNAVLSLFSTRAFSSGLSILTMPALHWIFERQLLANREHGGAITGERKARSTYICAIERDPAVYYAALRYVPGGQHGISRIGDRVSSARQGIRTRAITRYYLCSFEDYTKDAFGHDGAWLDFNGPITTNRLACIELLWKVLKSRLVITAMDARYDAAMSARRKFMGGVIPVVLNSLPESDLIHELHYQDGVPMVQFALDKKRSGDFQ